MVPTIRCSPTLPSSSPARRSRRAGALTASLLVAAAAAAPAAARAQLLITPGANAFEFRQDYRLPPFAYDDWSGTVDLDGDVFQRFTFYGADYGVLEVSPNGYIGLAPDYYNDNVDGSLSRDRGVGELAAAAGGPVLAPLYDDLYGDDAARFYGDLTDQYAAFTWQDFQSYDDPDAGRSTFQAALFFAQTTVGSFTFQPGDAAFSYAALGHPISGLTATVGVANDLETFTGAPGTLDGQLLALGGLPTSGGRFLLVRANALGGYTISEQSTAVVTPEPTSAVLLGAGVVGLGAFARRRRTA